MKIVTWNINGIRSLKTPLKDVFDKLAADIICFQETKITRCQVDDQVAFIDGYTSYFSFPRYQSGYSGVATYVADKACPIKAEEGLSGVLSVQNKAQDVVGNYGSVESLPLSEQSLLDGEGRALITKHMIRCKDDAIKNLAVINVYCPRADPEKPERATLKMHFYKLLQSRAEALIKGGCHVVIAGDINTSHKPIDHCDPGEEEEFSSRPSRKWMDHLLRIPTKDERTSDPHFIDSFRHFHPNDKNAFTCWCNVTGARKTNYGTRIDYIICDSGLISHLSDTVILPEIEGSDHCPVAAFTDIEPIAASKCPALCTFNWPEFAGKQTKILNFITKGVKNDRHLQTLPTSDTKVSPVRKKNAKSLPVNNQRTIASFFKVSSVIKGGNVTGSPDIDILEVSSDASQNDEMQSSQSSDISQAASSQPESDTNSVEYIDNEHSHKFNETTPADEGNSAANKNKNSQANVWKNLLSGPQKPPLCKGHQEPCILRTVKKQGVNFGRQFYVCGRPDGHANNPEARCNHFQWFSFKKKKIV